MNGLLDGTVLRNKYFILRHGESETNVTGLVISDPGVGTIKYGLTSRGREAVSDSIYHAKEKGQIDGNTVIYSSDFKRAIETAEIVRKILGAGKINTSVNLRERDMGTFNGKLVRDYIEIWPLDKLAEAEQIKNRVEGPGSMKNRMLKFINGIDAKYENQTILIVSHGDPLCVLQAAVTGSSMPQRRAMHYIQPGELQELKLTRAA